VYSKLKTITMKNQQQKLGGYLWGISGILLPSIEPDCFRKFSKPACF
jgi:hypothetical protein